MPYKLPEARKARMKAYAKENREKLRESEYKYRQSLRAEMILAYGRDCKHCGESNPLVLVLDHIFDNAQDDRKKNGHNGGYHMYRQLKAKGWPQGELQLLCHNCNFIKEYKRRNAQRI